MGVDSSGSEAVLGVDVTTDLAELGLMFLGCAIAKRHPTPALRQQMRDAIAAAKGVPGEDIEGEAESIAEAL